MTEPNHQDELHWGEIGTPTDLWRVGKALTFVSLEQAREVWSTVVDALERLCIMAESPPDRGLPLSSYLKVAVVYEVH